MTVVGMVTAERDGQYVTRLNVYADGSGAGAGSIGPVPEPATSATVGQLLCVLVVGAWYNQFRVCGGRTRGTQHDIR